MILKLLLCISSFIVRENEKMRTCSKRQPADSIAPAYEYWLKENTGPISREEWDKMNMPPGDVLVLHAPAHLGGTVRIYSHSLLTDSACITIMGDILSPPEPQL